MNTTKTRQTWNVYVRSGFAFVPNVVRTEAGYFMDTAPIRMVSLNDPDSLVQAIDQAISDSNLIVPTPSRAEFPPAIILEPAGVRTWDEFEKGSACFSVIRGDEGDELIESGRTETGGWTHDSTKDQKCLRHLSSSEVAKWIITRIRERTDLT